MLLLSLSLFPHPYISKHAAAYRINNITVDFGMHQNASYPIPASMFGLSGYGFIGIANQIASYLPPAGLATIRTGSAGGVNLSTIFPSIASATDPSQQNWSAFDTLLTALSTQNLHAILLLSYSPPWLQPQNQNPPLNNPCITNQKPALDPSYVKPTYMINGVDTGATMWASLAAAIVAHVDNNFPTLQPKYEIWNEPDTATYLCVPDSLSAQQQDALRLSQYKALYTTAAQAMKQQAQIDNTAIQIGGPALAKVKTEASIWLPSFLSDPTTAPYVDFVTYHQYILSASNDSWDQTTPSLLNATQNRQNGVSATFEKISAYVRAGSQPYATSTPIYIDEYNTNTGLPDCCRNNPTYAPLWNSLFVTDILNSVIDTHSTWGPAQALPHLTYFATNYPPPKSFCMFGDPTNYDCALTNNIQPYPQYYSYRLLSDPNYLNLNHGGFIANSASAKLSGIDVTGFFTNTANNIFIVNTSNNDYTNLNVFAKNAGDSASQQTAQLYVLNSENPSISSLQTTLTRSSDGSGYYANFSVPHYSTVALSIPV